MYIYHHLGLGDHIICHGIVRNICHKYFEKEHTLCLKPQFLTSVGFMYRDIKNLKLKPFLNDHEVHLFLNSIKDEQILYIGHHHLSEIMNNGYNFDEAFYKQVGLNFQKRWTNFKIERDYNRETKLLKKISPPSEYIFLHDGSERGPVIDREKIQNKSLPIITPNTEYTDNIFDYLSLIERATEIHCFDSSFKLMIDSILHDRSNLFYHIKLMNEALRPHTTASKLSWVLV